MHFFPGLRPLPVLLLAALWPSLAAAQIANVADAASRQVAPGLTATGEVSWEKKTGNNETSQLSAATTGYYKDGDHTTMLILRREFGAQKGSVSSNSTFEHLRHRYAVTEKLDAEAFVQNDSDPFRRIRTRFVAGAGPRALVYSGSSQTLYLALAPMYENEHLNPGPDRTEKLAYVRTRLSLSCAYDLKLDERLSLHNTAYYQPVLTALSNRRLEDEASVAIKIYKHLDFKLTAVIAHDSLPPLGIKPLDQQYKNSLVFTF